MFEYTCTYLTDDTHTARAAYHAEWIDQAMAMHNTAMPEFADRVIKWVSPEGITFHMHDRNASL